eukprot:COSAG02_NODE_2595_length_8458_cov_15.193205_2_plen_80_part_00
MPKVAPVVSCSYPPPPSSILCLQVPLFKVMNQDERSTLATVMEPRQFLEGDHIITQGAQGDCLYIMAMGQAYVTLTFQP